MKSRLLAFFFCLAILAGEAVFAQLPTMELSAGIYVIRAEIASTFETRMQGLMFRKRLGQNEGMLFVFPQIGRAHV